MPWLLRNQEGARPPHHAEAEEVRRQSKGSAGSRACCRMALAQLCQRDPLLLPKKARAVWSGKSTSSPSYLESSFLPQNCPKGQCGCEGEQEWAAFIANACQGAEYLARHGLSEMLAVFRRDRRQLSASRAVMSGRDASHPHNPPTNTQLYLISIYGVIYPVF